MTGWIAFKRILDIHADWSYHLVYNWYPIWTQIWSSKSDADCCFLPASSSYWISYLVGRIQNGWWGPWSVGTGTHISWAQCGWGIHLVWQPWMLIRVSDWISWGDFSESEEVDGGINWLGDCPCSIFTWDDVRVVDNQPSLLRPSWRPQQSGGGGKGSTGKGSWVVAVIYRRVDEPSGILCSPACLFECSDEDKFWACTKSSHQGWRGVGGEC